LRCFSRWTIGKISREFNEFLTKLLSIDLFFDRLNSILIYGWKIVFIDCKALVIVDQFFSFSFIRFVDFRLDVLSIFFSYSFKCRPRNSSDEQWNRPDRNIHRKGKEEFILGIKEENNFSSCTNGQLITISFI
jgi:hypothetical protein